MEQIAVAKDSGGPPQLPEREMLAARAGFRAALGDLPPQLSEAAHVWLETISPPNWALEWSLPHWLGESFGLSIETTRRLILSNVLGLAHIRLQDVLIDGERRNIGPREAVLLSGVFYRLWAGAYIDLFGSDRRFWGHFDRYLNEWLCATADSNAGPLGDFGSYTQGDFLWLAHRGAPLKICCAAACLKAGREPAIPALEAAVDRLMAAAVLLDHAQDWSDDLAAGRYNAFVAYASPLPQTRGRRAVNRRKVLEELYLGKAARPYFQVVRDHLRVSRENAQTIGCSELEHYLAWLDARATAYGERMADRAAALFDSAVQQSFGFLSVTGVE
jgi:hypothetical protein